VRLKYPLAVSIQALKVKENYELLRERGRALMGTLKRGERK